MCRKGLSDAELEALLYESSDSEVYDNIETEELEDSESDDSVYDPDYRLAEEEQEDAYYSSLMVACGEQNSDIPVQVTKKQRLVSPDSAGPSCSGLQHVVSYIRILY